MKGPPKELGMKVQASDFSYYLHGPKMDGGEMFSRTSPTFGQHKTPSPKPR